MYDTSYIDKIGKIMIDENYDFFIFPAAGLERRQDGEDGYRIAIWPGWCATLVHHYPAGISGNNQ